MFIGMQENTDTGINTDTNININAAGYNNKNIILHNILKSFFIFLAFFLAFYFYQRTIVFETLYAGLLFQALFFLLFLITVFKINIGLFIFIFFIPLFNSLAPRIGVSRVDIIFYLFIGVFLGFLVNKFSVISFNKSYVKKDLDYKINSFSRSFSCGIIYDVEIIKPIIIFTIILSISALITIFRYSNFYPFITTKFHDLVISRGGYTSLGSIRWTIKYYFNYIAGFGLMVIVLNSIQKIKDFFIAVRIIIFAALIVITFGLYQAYFDPFFLNSRFWVESGRINSLLSDPNGLGSYIAMLFPVFFSLILFLKKWYLKVAGAAFLSVFTYIGFLSSSRSAFLVIFISIIFYIIIGITIPIKNFIIKKIKGTSKINKGVFISSVIVLLIFIIIFSSISAVFYFTNFADNLDKVKGLGINLVDRFVETIQDYVNSLKSGGFERAFVIISSGREILWRQAVYMLKDHPVSGVGSGAYFIELPDYHRRYHRGYHIYDFTGNYYLQVLAELGLAGFLLNIFIFFLIAKKVFLYFLKKNRNNSLSRSDWILSGLYISFLCMCVGLFFGSHTNFMEIQFLFWLVIGLMFAYINIQSFDSSSILKLGAYKEIKFGKVSKIILAIVLVLFSALLFKGSITDLSINVKQTLYWNEDLRNKNSYGFYKEEIIDGEKVRWAGIDASQVVNINFNDIKSTQGKNTQEKNEQVQMTFFVKDKSPIEYRFPLFVRFYIDNWLVKVVKINDKNWHQIKIDLTKFSIYNKKRLTFTMSCSRGWVPKELGVSSDTRELGVLFKEETNFIK